MRAVVVDRDGTLVDVVRDADLGVITTAFHPDQLRFLPGVVDGLRALAAAGFAIGVATNQPGAAKGQIPRAAIERTNAALLARLAAEGVAVAALEVCLHHPEGGPGGDAALVCACDCRKPAPGMLRALAERMGFDPAQSWMIGDSAADVAAGRAAGMRTGLVFDARRCELCPLRDGAPPGAEVTAARFDVLATRIVEVAAAAP
jgi:D-glycero-D-manno-heptose 1,7-bisphosphate phosphatase